MTKITERQKAEYEARRKMLRLQSKESKPAVRTKQKILSGIRRYYKGGKV